MTLPRKVKYAAIAWIVCSVLTWTEFAYETRGAPLIDKALALPVMIVAWPVRLYVLANRPPLPPWILTVSEPAQGGGFSTGYDSEAACNATLRPWLEESAEFKAAGHEKDAPVATCLKR